MNIIKNALKNGLALKAIAVLVTIAWWVSIFQSRADTIQQGGYKVDPETQNPIGQAGTPIDLGYAFILFMVVFFPPIAATFYLGVLQKRNFEASETGKDDLRRVDKEHE